MRPVLAFILLLSAAPSWADDDLPFVQEEYDCLLVIVDEASYYTGARILFVRDGKLFASRHTQDEMVWVARDGKFELIWRDYWMCDRRIIVGAIAVMNYRDFDDPLNVGGPWWNQNRPMVDLKQP